MITQEQSGALSFEESAGETDNPDGEENGGPIAKASGVVSKGNGECFLTEEKHMSLTIGGGQAGQGYPAILKTESISFQERAGKPGGGKGILIQNERTGALSTLNNQSVATFMQQEEKEVTAIKENGSRQSHHGDALCLNDQGGGIMEVTKNKAGTLRAQEHGHQPIIIKELKNDYSD